MASPVARVGNATRQPPAPEREARISAAARAASVLPSPIGASITRRPAASISRATRTDSACTGRIAGRSPGAVGKLNLAAKRSAAAPSTSCARQGAGRSNPRQAASSRRASPIFPAGCHEAES